MLIVDLIVWWNICMRTSCIINDIENKHLKQFFKRSCKFKRHIVWNHNYCTGYTVKRGVFVVSQVDAQLVRLGIKKSLIYTHLRLLQVTTSQSQPKYFYMQIIFPKTLLLRSHLWHALLCFVTVLLSPGYL